MVSYIIRIQTYFFIKLTFYNICLLLYFIKIKKTRYKLKSFKYKEIFNTSIILYNTNINI